MLAGGRQSVRHKVPGRASGEVGSGLVCRASRSGSEQVTRLRDNRLSEDIDKVLAL
jgi:hypothetical protein